MKNKNGTWQPEKKTLIGTLSVTMNRSCSEWCWMRWNEGFIMKWHAHLPLLQWATFLKQSWGMPFHFLLIWCFSTSPSKADVLGWCGAGRVPQGVIHALTDLQSKNSDLSWKRANLTGTHLDCAFRSLSLESGVEMRFRTSWLRFLHVCSLRDRNMFVFPVKLCGFIVTAVSKSGDSTAPAHRIFITEKQLSNAVPVSRDDASERWFSWAAARRATDASVSAAPKSLV